MTRAKEPSKLREEAEAAVHLTRAGLAEAGAPERLVYELEVHQHELEIQNEELRRIQLELEQSRDRYYELYDLAPVAYLTLDRAGKVMDANLTAALLVGVVRTQLVGRPLSAFLGSSGSDALHLLLGRVFATGAREIGELEVVPADRAPVSVQAIAQALRSAGEPLTCRCALVDLSELRSAEARLEESNERFREMAEAIDDVFYVRETSGEVSYLSPACTRLFGRSPEALRSMGSTFADVVHEEDRARVREAHRQKLLGAAFDIEYRIVRPDGELRRVHHRAFRVGDPSGKVRRVVGIIRDVTAERALEEDLHHAQKMEAVGALASGVAHDFNNVLHAIVGLASMLSAEGTTVEQIRDYAARIAKVAKRGGDVANRLTAFARKRAQVGAAHELDDLLREVVVLLRPLVTESVQIELAAGAPGALVVCEPSQIEQILMNLAANARDAMPEGGTLRIVTEVVSEDAPARHRHWLEGGRAYVRLTVRDTGSGLDDSTRQRIFEPFFTTKAQGKGTGLGLSTVFALVRQLGGHIDVESRLGKGTTFLIDLPVVERPSAPVADTVASTRLEGRVLVVEDEALVRLTVRHYLEEIGLEVVEAADGEAALEIVEAERGGFAAVLTDLVMPAMMGDKLAEQIVARLPELPVLLMTASPDVPDAGAWPVIRKPFTKEELAAKLSAVIRR